MSVHAAFVRTDRERERVRETARLSLDVMSIVKNSMGRVKEFLAIQRTRNTANWLTGKPGKWISGKPSFWLSVHMACRALRNSEGGPAGMAKASALLGRAMTVWALHRGHGEIAFHLWIFSARDYIKSPG